MIRFLKYVVLAVVAILLLLLAFANRQIVTISFDPFSSSDEPAFAISAPLFEVVIVFAMLGVVVGATATWFAQGRYRRAARRHRAEAERLRAESDALKAAQPQASTPAPTGR
ncbi:MAG TPA: DUF3611 family protein [Roseiarcus sp.]|jgi:uncharacterized integral membrane protein|nr:DUF3611 family protein [Roseiarcus sp.]